MAETYPTATTGPEWPTTVHGVTRDGRLMGADGSIQIYRAIPMGPVDGAKTTAQLLSTADPLRMALDGLGTLPKLRAIKSRRVNKSAYRPFHILLIDVPTPFRPIAGHVRYNELMRDMDGREMLTKFLVLGTPVYPEVNLDGGVKKAVNSLVESLVYSGTSLDDYQRDTRRVEAIFDRAGLYSMNKFQRRMLTAWFNHGRTAEVSVLPHPDKLDVFSDHTAAAVAKELLDSGVLPSDLPDLPGAHSLRFGAVSELSIQHESADGMSAQWATQLVDAGARAISVRGLIEPGTVTSGEISKRRQAYLDKVGERADRGRVGSHDEATARQELEEVQAVYSGSHPPATVINATITVAFDGDKPVNERSTNSLSIEPVVSRQATALAEMWPCSHIRANTFMHELPSFALAYSGLPAMSTVGDYAKEAALVGLTEYDRQAAYHYHRAEVHANGPVFTLIFGGTGSGKTTLVSSLIYQTVEAGAPALYLQPKYKEDASEILELIDGRLIELGDLVGNRGMFDPMTYSETPAEGVDAAVGLLLSVDPWVGSTNRLSQADLVSAMGYGASNGGMSIGHSLRIARDAGMIEPWAVDQVFKLADNHAAFGAMISNAEYRDETNSLRLADGLTLIQAGGFPMDIPTSGTTNTTMIQRISVALLKQIVTAGVRSLSGRGGAMYVDEAHVLLESDPAEVDKLGRTMRSMGVKLYMLTQKITDVSRNDLEGYIGSSFVLGMNDEKEAAAACDLVGLEKTPERMRRLLAKPTLGKSRPDQEAPPNYESMRALYRNGKLVRGSIAIFSDTSDNSVNVEVYVPDELLRRVSTSPEDIAARKERQSARRAAQMAGSAV